MLSRHSRLALELTNGTMIVHSLTAVSQCDVQAGKTWQAKQHSMQSMSSLPLLTKPCIEEHTQEVQVVNASPGVLQT